MPSFPSLPSSRRRPQSSSSKSPPSFIREEEQKKAFSLSMEEKENGVNEEVVGEGGGEEGGEEGKKGKEGGKEKNPFSFRSPLKAFRSPPAKTIEGGRGGEEGRRLEKNEEPEYE